MSFTRFHDDPARIKYGLEISTYSGRYSLDTPGPGVNLPYLEDTQIRMQTNTHKHIYMLYAYS